jgi:hypothetical protein
MNSRARTQLALGLFLILIAAFLGRTPILSPSSCPHPVL